MVVKAGMQAQFNLLWHVQLWNASHWSRSRTRVGQWSTDDKEAHQPVRKCLYIENNQHWLFSVWKLLELQMKQENWLFTHVTWFEICEHTSFCFFILQAGQRRHPSLNLSWVQKQLILPLHCPLNLSLFKNINICHCAVYLAVFTWLSATSYPCNLPSRLV